MSALPRRDPRRVARPRSTEIPEWVREPSARRTIRFTTRSLLRGDLALVLVFAGLVVFTGVVIATGLLALAFAVAYGLPRRRYAAR